MAYGVFQVVEHERYLLGKSSRGLSKGILFLCVSFFIRTWTIESNASLMLEDAQFRERWEGIVFYMHRVVFICAIYNVIAFYIAGEVGNYFRRLKYFSQIPETLGPALVTMSLFVILFLFYSTYICAGLGNQFETLVERSFIANTRKYSSNKTVAAYVDNIQIEFKCCGGMDHREWFAILGGSKTKKQQVPLSCCNNEDVFPCPYYNLKRLSYFNNIRGKAHLEDRLLKKAIYTDGCSATLGKIFKDQLRGSQWLMVLLVVAQCAQWMWLKVLVTAVRNTLWNRDLLAPAPTWLFSFGTADCTIPPKQRMVRP